jgi:hypothetical protein
MLTAHEIAVRFPGYVRRKLAVGSSLAELPLDPEPRAWLVRFRYSLKGEAPEIAQQVVKGHVSEASAIKAAVLQKFGGVNRPLHSLQMLEVRAL